jgi:hypothetical protein
MYKYMRVVVNVRLCVCVGGGGEIEELSLCHFFVSFFSLNSKGIIKKQNQIVKKWPFHFALP